MEETILETRNLSVGYDGGFTDIEKAVEEYCQILDKTGGYYTRQG